MNLPIHNPNCHARIVIGEPTIADLIGAAFRLVFEAALFGLAVGGTAAFLFAAVA